jgi:hypothetical protein
MSAAARVFAKMFMFKAVGVRDVAEGSLWQLEVSFVNCGTKIGQQRWAEVDEFMCGKDGRVAEEVPKKETRGAYGF